MKAFWQAIAKLGAKLAVWAAEHPDQAVVIVRGVAKAAKTAQAPQS